MATEILKERLSFNSNKSDRREVLVDEVEDLQLLCCSVPPYKSVTSHATAHRGRAIIFILGQSQINEAAYTFATSGLAVYCPAQEAPFTVRAASETVVYLELNVAFSVDDQDAMIHNKDGFFPWFIGYDDCPTYTERFKSPKTVSRTLLPHDRFPRLCVGSVETSGPDEVGAHSHPMLEQVFIGLSDNDCRVMANGFETHLGALEALHIPLGSNHGARVDTGRTMHYIWIDLFRRGADMGWVSQGHIPEQ